MRGTKLRRLSLWLAISSLLPLLTTAIVSSSPAAASCTDGLLQCTPTDLINLAVNDAEACLAGNDGICAPLESLAQQIEQLVLQRASACLAGNDPTCQTVVAVLNGLGPFVLSIAENCASGGDPTCNSAEQIAQAAVSLAVQTAEECINGTSSTCNAVVGLVNLVVNVALGEVTSCVDDPNSICNSVIPIILFEVQATENTVSTCLAGTNTICNDVFGLEQLVVSAVNNTVNACLNGTDQTCATALATARNAVGTAQSCLAGTNGTCNLLTQTVTSLVALVVATGTSCVNGSNSTCNQVVQDAEQVESLVVSTAESCANGTNPTCNMGVQLIEQEAALIVATAQSCVAGANSACSLALQTVESVVAAGLSCASGGGPCAVVINNVLTVADTLAGLINGCVAGGQVEGVSCSAITTIENDVTSIVAGHGGYFVGVGPDDNGIPGLIFLLAPLSAAPLDAAAVAEDQDSYDAALVDTAEPAATDPIDLGAAVTEPWVGTTGLRAPPPDENIVVVYLPRQDSNHYYDIPYRRGYYYAGQKPDGWGWRKVTSKHNLGNNRVVQDAYSFGDKEKSNGPRYTVDANFYYYPPDSNTPTKVETVHVVTDETDTRSDNELVGLITAYCIDTTSGQSQTKCPNWINAYNGNNQPVGL